MPLSSVIIIKDLIKRDILRWKKHDRVMTGRINFNVPTADADFAITGTAINTVAAGDLVNLSVAGTDNTLNISSSATINGDLTVTGKIISG